jgi:hypothetical protein
MARGGEHDPINNGLSKPARRGGHGRDRPRSSSVGLTGSTLGWRI